MSKINFNNTIIGLSEEQIKIIYDKALYLIKNVGIKVPHKGILSLLSDYDGVIIVDDIVCFDEELVKKAVKNKKYIYPDYAKDSKIFILGGAHIDTLYDIYTGKLKSSTAEDLVNLTKLSDYLNVTGSAPVRPLDIPVHLQEIMMYKISWENSRIKGNDIFEHNPKSTVRCANYIYEMAKAADKWFSVALWMISPRNFASNDLEVIFQFKDKKVPMCITTMPIAGATAPINLLGAYTQSLFELFAGLTLLNLVNPDGLNYCPPFDNIRAYYFDMKYGNFIYGSPEDVKGTIYQVNLNNYFNMPIVAKALLTSSKEPDGQACFEKGVHTMTAMLMGVCGFTNAGTLSVDEIYSAEQLVLDCEIVEYCSNVIKEEEFSEENFYMDDIINTGPHNTFMDKDSTLFNYKKLMWEPNLFIHDNLGQWTNNNKKSLYQRANTMVKDILLKHRYEIDANLKKELDRIYKIAEKDIKLEESFKAIK